MMALDGVVTATPLYWSAGSTVVTITVNSWTAVAPQVSVAETRILWAPSVVAGTVWTVTSAVDGLMLTVPPPGRVLGDTDTPTKLPFVSLGNADGLTDTDPPVATVGLV